MRWLRSLGLLLLPAFSATGTPLSIGSGLVALRTIGATFYVDRPAGLCGTGFVAGLFGSLDGVPSNCVHVDTLGFIGNPGVAVGGQFSNLIVDSLGVGKSSPSPNFGITWRDSTGDPAMADTVLQVLPSVVDLGSCLDCPFNLNFQLVSLSLRSTTPLLVTYGTGPDARTLSFDYTLQATSSPDLNPISAFARRDTDTSGHFYFGSSARIQATTITFTNPMLGSFTTGANLNARMFGSGDWHLTPEPSSIGLAGLGAILLGLKGWRRRPHPNS